MYPNYMVVSTTVVGLALVRRLSVDHRIGPKAVWVLTCLYSSKLVMLFMISKTALWASAVPVFPPLLLFKYLLLYKYLKLCSGGMIYRSPSGGLILGFCILLIGLACVPIVGLHFSHVMGFESYMKSERKCYMLGARELSIAWGNDTRYWKWGHVPDSRDQKVAILKQVWWLDIQGKISSVMLSPKTVYAAYLVFQIPRGSSRLSGLGKTKVSYGGVQNESNIPLQQMMEMANAQPPRNVGWMEIKLGELYCDDGYEGDVEIVFQEHDQYKEGLIVKGIEIRPVYGNSRSYE